MTSPDLSCVLSLYQRVLPAGVIEYFAQQADLRSRRGIYSVAVVLWLMMVQRWQRGGTLASSVQHLVQGTTRGLLGNCKRVREGRISARTGGYCQARRRLPKRIAEQVTDEIVERLRAQLSEPFPGLDRPVLLLDGSSLQLARMSHHTERRGSESDLRGDLGGDWAALSRDRAAGVLQDGGEAQPRAREAFLGRFCRNSGQGPCRGLCASSDT